MKLSSQPYITSLNLITLSLNKLSKKNRWAQFGHSLPYDKIQKKLGKKQVIKPNTRKSSKEV